MVKQSCTSCKSVPLDILTLQCDHSICIKCSSRLCSQINFGISCPKCRNITYLSEQILNQIYEKQRVNQQKQQRCRQKKPSYQYPEQGKFSDQYRRTNRNYSFTNGMNKQNLLKQNIGLRDSRLNQYNEQIYQGEANFRDSRNLRTSKRKVQIYEAKENAFIKKEGKTSKTWLKGQENTFDHESFNLYCKQHSQYEIMYVCQQCQNNFLCPECVIHGEHRNHNVQTVKKTLCRVQAELQSKVYSMDCSIEGLIQASKQKKLKLQQKISQINYLKQEARQKYGVIRKQLDRQETEVMKKCGSLIQCYSRQFSEVQKWITKDLSQIQRQKQIINNILNPSSSSKAKIKQKKRKGENKLEQKIMQLRMLRQYYLYLQKYSNNQTTNSKQNLWINKKDEDEVEPQCEQSLEALTDRIQKIKYKGPQNNLQCFNNATTKHPSLACSRAKETKSVFSKSNNSLKQSKQNSRNNYYVESPFNNLKMSTQKQNSFQQAESILIKGSYLKQQKKIKSQVKNLASTNTDDIFLVF